MPPKAPATSATPGRPDPITLDHLFEVLASKDNSPENRAYLILALSTVAHHPVVKQILANDKYNNVLKVLILSLMQRDVYAAESRWETLTVIGELCRAEHRNDVHGQSADALDAVSKYFYEYFANQPLLKMALEELLKEEAFAFVDEDCRICAKDIYEALIGKIDNVSVGKRSKGGKAVGEGVEEEKEEDKDKKEGEEKRKVTAAAGARQWTKQARERCKDLMFLDATDRFTLIPLVTRSSSLSCAACQKALETPKPLRCGQCKSVYYCSQPCQVEHWKQGHKTPCTAMKGMLETYLIATCNGKRKAPASVALPLEPSLFYETRPYLFAHRPDTLKSIGFEKYFMEYYHPTF